MHNVKDKKKQCFWEGSFRQQPCPNVLFFKAGRITGKVHVISKGQRRINLYRLVNKAVSNSLSGLSAVPCSISKIMWLTGTCKLNYVPSLLSADE